MKDLDGKTVPIGKLLSQEFFFRVPDYQRPFSWDGDNFDDLIDDLLTANQDQDYFLRTIVLHGDKGNFEVVDGQQRLTSLMILLACLRDKLQDNKLKQGAHAFLMSHQGTKNAIFIELLKPR